MDIQNPLEFSTRFWKKILCHFISAFWKVECFIQTYLECFVIVDMEWFLGLFSFSCSSSCLYFSFSCLWTPYRKRMSWQLILSKERKQLRIMLCLLHAQPKTEVCYNIWSTERELVGDLKVQGFNPMLMWNHWDWLQNKPAEGRLQIMCSCLHRGLQEKMEVDYLMQNQS